MLATTTLINHIPYLLRYQLSAIRLNGGRPTSAVQSLWTRITFGTLTIRALVDFPLTGVWPFGIDKWKLWSYSHRSKLWKLFFNHKEGTHKLFSHTDQLTVLLFTCNMWATGSTSFFLYSFHLLFIYLIIIGGLNYFHQY